MLDDPPHITQVFERATLRMRPLLRDDNPHRSRNSAVDDEFHTVECLSGVIYEVELDDASLGLESSGSTAFCLNDVLTQLNEE